MRNVKKIWFSPQFTANCIVAVVMLLALTWILNPKVTVVEKEVVVETNTQIVIPRIMQVNLPRVLYSEDDLYVLSEAIYFEARSEPLDCQAQVGYTVLNRVEKRGLSVRKTIWKSRQFSYTQDGKHERMVNENARQVAQSVALLVLNGYAKDYTKGGEYFFNPSIVDWKFEKDYTFTMDCGSHRFLR